VGRCTSGSETQTEAPPEKTADVRMDAEAGNVCTQAELDAMASEAQQLMEMLSKVRNNFRTTVVFEVNRIFRQERRTLCFGNLKFLNFPYFEFSIMYALIHASIPKPSIALA
jgi:hypothetical protein